MTHIVAHTDDTPTLLWTAEDNHLSMRTSAAIAFKMPVVVFINTARCSMRTGFLIRIQSVHPLIAFECAVVLSPFVLVVTW